MKPQIKKRAVDRILAIAFCVTLVTSSLAQTWTPERIHPGLDGRWWLVWGGYDGGVALWRLAADTTIEATTAYGPYAGWNCQQDWLQVGLDGKPRLGWKSDGGAISLWTLSAGAQLESTANYGPYSGWTPKATALVSGTKSEVLWQRDNNGVSLWYCNSAGGFETAAGFGPYSGWTAKSLDGWPDGKTALRWSSASEVAFWLLASNGAYERSLSFGIPPGWTQKWQKTRPDGRLLVGWEGSSKQIALWLVNRTGGLDFSPVYGPYSGWEPYRLSGRPDNKAVLIWKRANGEYAVWWLGTTLAIESAGNFGPYAGWELWDVAGDATGGAVILWRHVSGGASIWRFNSAGTFLGATSPNPNAATLNTTAATTVTGSSSTLNGTANLHRLGGGVWFEWGLDPNLTGAASTTHQSTSLPPEGAVGYTQGLTGLLSGRTYYFRIVAETSAGTVRGQILSFATTGTVNAPTVTTQTATSVAAATATLNGTVNPNGVATTGAFEWGTSSALASYSTTSQQNLGAGTTAQPLTASLTGLTPATPYYFRTVASGGGATARGAIQPFTTTSATTIVRVVNKTHYDMMDIQFNSFQKVSYPNAIAAGQSYDLTVTPGVINYYLGVGYWASSTSRNEYFHLTGQITATAGQTTTLTFDNPTIGQLLANFNSNGRLWVGPYWDANNTPHSASYRFYSNGQWNFYDDGVLKASGTATLVSWADYSDFVSFKLSSTSTAITFAKPWASFQFRNGPSSWPTIEYTAQ